MSLHSCSGSNALEPQPHWKNPLPIVRNHSDTSILPSKRSVSARLEVPKIPKVSSYPNALVENTSPSASSFSSISLSEDHFATRRKAGLPPQPVREALLHESAYSSTEWSRGVTIDHESDRVDNKEGNSQEAPRQELQPIQAGTKRLPTLQKPQHRRANTQPGPIAKAKIASERSHPFRRWMNTLRRAGEKEPVMLRQRENRWALDESAECLPQMNPPTYRQRPQRRTRSTSGTSSAFITGVKTASISLATISAPPTSRANFRRTLRSSDQSSHKARSFVTGIHSFVTSLVEDRSPATPAIDQASFNRAVQRRKTLEELVHTEESYVADLKVLVNVCFPCGMVLTDMVTDKLLGLFYFTGSRLDLGTP